MMVMMMMMMMTKYLGFDLKIRGEWCVGLAATSATLFRIKSSKI